MTFKKVFRQEQGDNFVSVESRRHVGDKLDDTDSGGVSERELYGFQEKT
jgi:hypothetical protein